MNNIRDFILAEPLFSTHDHQRGFAELETSKHSITYQLLFSYAQADLACAAGRTDGDGAPVSDEEFVRYWPVVRTTGYGQATALAARKILGLELESGNTAAVTQALRDFCRGKSAVQIYAELYRMANIRWDVNDTWWQKRITADVLSGREHPDCVRHTLRCDDDKLFVISTAEEIRGYEEAYQCAIHGLADLEQMMREYVRQAKEQGRLVALKSAVAYLRPLDFGPADRSAAESALQDILKNRPGHRRSLHDYLFHFYLRLGREFDLPVQLHTGFLARTCGDFRQGDPSRLVPVLQEYKDVRFDLFHAGWPFTGITAALGKAFPNVWLDLCWALAIDPVRARLTLEEWLGAVPHNKIFLFGADTHDPFTMVGYAEQARLELARVLEHKIAAGELDGQTAEHLAARLMHRNAAEFFRV